MRKLKPRTDHGPIRYRKGDLWKYHERGYWVVVTTNLGWKKDGTAIMGAGVAKQAAERFPEIVKEYGRLCKKYRDGRLGIVLNSQHKLIFFPTKPLDREKPWLSWKQKASMDLIEDSLDDLICLMMHDNIRPIAMPMVGCGNGGLDPKKVKSLLDRYLDGRFTVLY